MIVSFYPRLEGQIYSHIDSFRAFGQPIVGVSLGSTCTLRFRRERTRGKSIPVHLERRSMYVLTGPARWEYHHYIEKKSVIDIWKPYFFRNAA